MKLPDKHTRLPQKKTGVLINLGTPDSTKWWDIRKYLKEFLSDKKSYRSEPDIMADNFKSLHFNI